MNKDRRKAIEEARNLLGIANSKIDEARSMLEDIKAEEEDYRDNMPESLQQGEKGERANAACDALDEVVNELESIDFDSFFSNLDTAAE